MKNNQKQILLSKAIKIKIKKQIIERIENNLIGQELSIDMKCPGGEVRSTKEIEFILKRL